MRALHSVLFVSALALAWPATAASPTAAPARPWINHVRCAALMERMPEMMEFGVRVMDAAALTNPEVSAQLPKMKTALAEARPGLVQAGTIVREMAKAEVAKGHTAWAAGAAGADRTLSASALFDREMASARATYADVKFQALDEATTAGVERMRADMKTYCEALTAGG